MNPFGIIYVIRNLFNCKAYVGQTRNSLHTRWWYHKYYARIGRCTSLLYLAIRKYGPESFTVEQIDVANSKEELDQKEIFYISSLSSLRPGGYNLTSGGSGSPNHTLTDEARKLISKNTKGWRHTDAAKKKISEAGKRRKISDESKKKISKTNKGRRHSEETKKKISERTLEKMTFEARQKMSIAAKQRLHPRKKFCKRGHPFDDVNTYTAPKTGQQICRTCYYLKSNNRLPFRLRVYVESPNG